KGATFRFGERVTDVVPDGGGWRVYVDGGEPIAASAVILAAGGLSVPATGSDGVGLAIARRLGHTIHETYPALTPLTADPPLHAALAGISPVGSIEAPGTKFRTTGGFLFTHRGYSGPSVLDASHLAVRSRLAGEHQPLHVQWSPLDAAGWEAVLSRGGTGTVANIIR